ncbi:MAG: S8 family serine peptidase [Promethearchaeota archaeon]
MGSTISKNPHLNLRATQDLQTKQDQFTQPKSGNDINDSHNLISDTFIKRSTHLMDLILKDSLGSNITIALLSSGISNSSLYYNNTVFSFNIVDNTTAPIDNDGLGTILTELLLNPDTGLCPQASLMNIKVMDITMTTTDWIAAGINKAVEQHPDIILLGVNQIGGSKDAVNEAIKNAEQSNILIIVPSGDFGPGFGSLGEGAFNSYGIVVGAASHESGIMREVYDYDKYFIPDYSGRGPGIDGKVAPHLVAIGSNIGLPGLFMLNNTNVTFINPEKSSSTILAATIVAAGIACIESKLFKDNITDIPSTLVKIALLKTAFPLNPKISSYEQGNGYVNFWDSYLLIKEALQKNEVIETIFPRTPINQPYIYYNEKSQNFFSFIHQKIPINIVHYCYNPLIPNYVNQYEKLNKKVQADSYLGFYIGKTDFTGITSYQETLIISPFYQHHFTLNITSPTSESSLSFSIQLPQKKVSFDVGHDEDGYYFADTPTNNYWGLTNFFAQNNVMVQNITNFYNIQTDLLILADPEISYSKEETDEIHSYVQNGGKVLFIAGNREFTTNGSNQPDLQYKATNSTVLSEISSCGLVPSPSMNFHQISLQFNNLLVSNPFWFTPIYVENTFVDRSFLGFEDAKFDQILSSSYDIAVDGNNSLVRSVIGLDWIHERGVKLAIEQQGKGQIIISSTENLFSVYGQYFSQFIASAMNSKIFLEKYLMDVIAKNSLQTSISSFSQITLIGSHLIFTLKPISSDISIENMSVELIGTFLKTNKSFSAYWIPIGQKFFFFLPVPYHYMGELKIGIITRDNGGMSSYFEMTLNIKVSPLGYDIITLSCLIMIFLLSYAYKVSNIKGILKKYSKGKYKSKKYCKRCHLPLANQTICSFCKYENK